MTKPLLKCPECPKKFTTPQLVAMHRSRLHGVVGMSKSSLQLRAKRERDAQAAAPATPDQAAAPAPAAPDLPTFACPHCEFRTQKKAGLSIHIAQVHTKKETSLAIPSQNGRVHKADRQAAPDGIPEATLALALGRFQGLCAAMANEFDLPARRFAAALAELIYAAQVR